MNWKEERSKQIIEHILFAQLCSLAIMAAALFSTLNLPFTPNLFLSFRLIPAVIFTLFTLSIILYLQKVNTTTLVLDDPPGVVDIIISVLILTFTASITYITYSNRILFLVPVVYAAINYGKRIGYIFWACCTVLIVLFRSLHGSSWDINTIETDLLLVMIMFLAAWIIGGLIDIERDTIKKLSELADRDDLTGLWNKRFLYRKLEELFHQAEKKEANLSLIFADIDYFKVYNDALGHLRGDEVLRQIGRIIEATILPEGIAARYGGEEFAIILYGYSSEQALIVADNIRKEVESYPFTGKEYQPAQKITLSLGVATYPNHAKLPLELLRRADDALFRAKSVRRNKAEVYFSVFDEFSISFNNVSHDLLNSLKTLLCIIEAKDRYTRGHSERVTEYAMVISEHLGLTDEEKKIIRLSAFLHDVGKIEIDREILNKPVILNEAECNIIRQHPIWGAEIVSSIGLLNKCVPVVLSHHENFDGTGYPNGLKEEEIPFGARVLRVVDSFDAMVTNRPYRQGLSFEQSLAEIRQGAGSIYDPQVVSAFFEVADRISHMLAG